MKANHRMDAFCVVHSKAFVVSEDIDVLLQAWGEKRGFKIPDTRFFESAREEMKKRLLDFFPDVQFIKKGAIIENIGKRIPKGDASVVSLDKIYTRNARNLFEMEVTRMVGEDLEFLDNASRIAKTIEEQIEDLATLIAPENRKITLVDDVIFTGENLVSLIKKFRNAGICVSGVISGISVEAGTEKILNEFDDVSIFSVIHYKDIVDEICERDFYVGIPLSGRLVGHRKNGVVVPISPETGVPYLLPFADEQHAVSWSSVPEEHIRDWSRFCLEQSLKLWEEIEILSEKKVFCSDLERNPVSFGNEGSLVEKIRECLHGLQ